MTRRRATQLVLLVAICASCGGDDLRHFPPLPLGASVIEISSEQFRSARRFDLVEELRLSVGQDTTLSLDEITDLAILPNGNIYLLDGRNRLLVLLDPSGKHVHRIGREGEGPAEFRNPVAIAAVSDTVYVLDGISVRSFASDGRFLGVATLGLMEGNSLNAIDEFVRIPEGFIAASTKRASPAPGSDKFVDTTAVRFYNASDPSKLTTRFALPTIEWHLRGTTYFRVVLGPVPSTALAPDGTIFYTRGEDYLVEILDRDGRTKMQIRGAYKRVRYTRSEMQSELDRQLQEARKVARDSTSHVEDYSKQVRMLPRAEFRPVHGRVIVGPGSMILIERRDFGPIPRDPAADKRHDIVDLTTGYLGYVYLPAKVRPLLTHRHSVIGVERDSNDLPVLVRYSFDTTRGARTTRASNGKY